MMTKKKKILWIFIIILLFGTMGYFVGNVLNEHINEEIPKKETSFLEDDYKGTTYYYCKGKIQEVKCGT